MNSSTFDPDAYIYDANTETFGDLVLKNSQLGPVLVNFWSRKAGPCFRLYPVLEKLITTYSGAFLLVNVDADEQRKIAQDYAITSVPTLKLFDKEKVVETLFGYQNDEDLRFMLDQYVASENDVIIHQALQRFEQGETEAAYQMLGRAALASPHYYKFPLTIASLMRSEGRFEEALTLLHSLPQMAREKAASQRLMIECEFANMAAPVQDADDLKPFVRANPDELPAVKLLAAWHVTQRQYHEALALFEHIMQQDRDFEDDLGRRSIVKILSLIEDGHPLIKHYRDIIRKLNN